MNFLEFFFKFIFIFVIEKVEKEGNICEYELDILYVLVLLK